MQIANDFSERQMWEIFDNIVHDGHGDYSANIARWRSVFGDQLHILQYDDLAGSPSEFYTKVCAIIGIDPNKHVEPHLLEKLIFEGPRLDAPVDIVRQMTDMYRSTILECRARFPNEYTAQWASIYES